MKLSAKDKLLYHVIAKSIIWIDILYKRICELEDKKLRMIKEERELAILRQQLAYNLVLFYPCIKIAKKMFPNVTSNSNEFWIWIENNMLGVYSLLEWDSWQCECKGCNVE